MQTDVGKPRAVCKPTATSRRRKVCNGRRLRVLQQPATQRLPLVFFIVSRRADSLTSTEATLKDPDELNKSFTASDATTASAKVQNHRVLRELRPVRHICQSPFGPPEDRGIPTDHPPLLHGVDTVTLGRAGSHRPPTERHHREMNDEPPVPLPCWRLTSTSPRPHWPTNSPIERDRRLGSVGDRQAHRAAD